MAMVVVVIFMLLFKYAKVGVAMRATANDQTAAFSMGINVKSMFTISWAFGAIAASLGGIIHAYPVVAQASLASAILFQSAQGPLV